MLRRKLFALVGALLIGLLSVVPAFAAASNSVTDLRLAPGATFCLTPATPNVTAYSLADAQGTANNAATFVVYNGAVNATNPIYTLTIAGGFHQTFTPSFPMGAVFPGKFKVCATNPSTTSNTRIDLSITVN